METNCEKDRCELTDEKKTGASCHVMLELEGNIQFSSKSISLFRFIIDNAVLLISNNEDETVDLMRGAVSLLKVAFLLQPAVKLAEECNL